MPAWLFAIGLAAVGLGSRRLSDRIAQLARQQLRARREELFDAVPRVARRASTSEGFSEVGHCCDGLDRCRPQLQQVVLG